MKGGGIKGAGYHVNIGGFSEKIQDSSGWVSSSLSEPTALASIYGLRL